MQRAANWTAEVKTHIDCQRIPQPEHRLAKTSPFAEDVFRPFFWRSSYGNPYQEALSTGSGIGSDVQIFYTPNLPTKFPRVSPWWV